MEQVRMQALRRDETGKGAARKLRAAGFVPGVAYGMGRDSIALSIPVDALRAALRAHSGANVLLDLDIEGVEREQGSAALIKELQRHPLSREFLSLDLQWVSLTTAIEVEVPLTMVGEAAGTREGGSQEILLHQVRVSCLPTAIPETIELDVSEMAIGDTLHVSALKPRDGVEVLNPAEDPVVTILAPLTEEQLEARLSVEGLEGVSLEEELEEGEEPTEAPGGESEAEAD